MKNRTNMQVKAIPTGYHTVTSCLMVEGCEQLIDFLKRAFNAEELSRFNWQDGAVAHAEVRIGDSIIMLGEAKSPTLPMPCAIYLYVEDADETHRQAISAGATSILDPVNMFWGDRHGGVKDPFGNMWWIATHIEDMSREELQRRGDEWMRGQSQKKM